MQLYPNALSYHENKWYKTEEKSLNGQEQLIKFLVNKQTKRAYHETMGERNFNYLLSSMPADGSSGTDME